MSKNRKYYVVWKGNREGVFDSWDLCQEAIKGFSGAIYKSFPDVKMAKKAFEDDYHKYIGKDVPKKAISQEMVAIVGNPILKSISVDAACSSNGGMMEYQGVETATGKVIFHKGPFKDGTNNIGEFLALVHALALCNKNKWHDIPIYSDSRTAISWVRNKRANTKLELSNENKVLFELIERAEFWLKNNSWSNRVIKWETQVWGEIPADFGRK